MSLSLSITPRPIEVSYTIGSNLISQGLKFSQEVGKQCIITTETLLPILPPLPDPLVLPVGESIKNRAMKAWIEDILYERSANRDLIIIAIGGGTLIDLVGFVASTFMRGVPYILFPTTLLAMTDAAIGGKTGVNIKGAKNWIGSFYHPKHVYLDLDFLQTLPQDVWIDGLSESIKHGIIGDANLFSFIETHLGAILQREQQVISEMIQKSVSVKCQVVEQDPFEELEVRYILNFGHTIAHAIETATHYQCTHGKAVAIGMVVEAAMSRHLGLLSDADYKSIVRLIQAVPFGFEFPREVPFAHMKRDKKNGRFVALTTIGGECRLAPFDEQLVKKGWNDAVRDTQRELSSCPS